MLTNFLAKELLRYYRRVGNRIVFTNEMSLNQLAWEMWERLGYKEVDPSVISRVLKGERVFNFRQLSVFVQVMKIKNQGKQRLKRALYEELVQRCGLEEDFFRLRGKYLVDLSLESLQRAISEKEKGAPTKALELAEEIYGRIKEEIPFPSNKNNRKELLGVLANVIIEKQDLINISYTSEEGAALLKPLFIELNSIGKELNNNFLIWRSYFSNGDIFYIEQEYRNAIEWFLKAEGLMGEDKGVFDYRPLTVSFAKLNNGNSYKKFENKVLENLQKYSAGDRCVSLCGLTRASAFVNDRTKTEKYLSMAKSALINVKDNVQECPIQRQLQVARVELEVSETLKGGKNYYEKIGKDNLMLAKRLGFKRYEELISSSMNRILN